MVAAIAKAPAGPLLSRHEAAAYLGVTVQTLAHWACTNRVRLPFVRIGKLAKYRQADLEAFIARNVVNAGEAV